MVCREQNIGCSSSRCTTATLRASVASGFCDSGQATGDFQLHMNIANDICCSTYETGGFKKRLTYVRQRVQFHLAEFVALLCVLCFCGRFFAAIPGRSRLQARVVTRGERDMYRMQFQQFR